MVKSLSGANSFFEIHHFCLQLSQMLLQSSSRLVTFAAILRWHRLQRRCRRGDVTLSATQVLLLRQTVGPSSARSSAQTISQLTRRTFGSGFHPDDCPCAASASISACSGV